MVQVRLGGSLQSYSGGRGSFEIEGATIGQILAGLGEACPRLKPLLEQGVAVAVDGQIYRGSLLQPVRPDAEVFILPKLAGG
ncbi:MAG: ThiS family protein [Rhodospirillales bacterium]|jgi:molybdopterin converting factor small subunit|nr:ThiS family protein [Rhodospirillales bacterium]